MTEPAQITEGNEIFNQGEDKKSVLITNVENEDEEINLSQQPPFSDHSSDFGAIQEEENEDDSFEV